jgi:hypothetical protein
MAADHLHRARLVDCRGRITHVLTVQPDGSVRVEVGGIAARIDPRTRASLPVGANLGAGEYGHREVLDIACSLAAELDR